MWLRFLEMVVSRGLEPQFNFDYRLTMLLVLWALGWAMIVLSALVDLPPAVAMAFGIAMYVAWAVVVAAPFPLCHWF